MGGGSWTRDAYSTYASSTKLASKSISETFSQRSVHKNWDLKNVMIRESRDSDEHPNSTPIMIGLDVTGSMGIIPHNLIKKGLPDLMDKLLGSNQNGIIADPQVMFLGIGDLAYDSAPIQASQFESDIRIVEQLSQLFIERGGGGNGTESYDLAWVVAANYTSTDSWEKRGKKGYLFTIGDELPPISSRILSENTGRLRNHLCGIEKDLDRLQMLEKARERYSVFHLIIEQGGGIRNYGLQETINQWREVLGNNAVLVNDYEKLPEIIASIIQVCEGRSASDVIALYEGDTRRSVERALTE